MKFFVQKIEPNRFYGFTIVLQKDVSSAERKRIRGMFEQAAEPVFQGVREEFRERYTHPEEKSLPSLMVDIDDLREGKRTLRRKDSDQSPSGVGLVGYELGFISSSDPLSHDSAEELQVLQPGGSYIVFALLQTGRTTTGEFEEYPDPEEIEENYRQLSTMLSTIYRKKDGNGGVGLILLYNAGVQTIISEQGFLSRGFWVRGL